MVLYEITESAINLKDCKSISPYDYEHIAKEIYTERLCDDLRDLEWSDNTDYHYEILFQGNIVEAVKEWQKYEEGSHIVRNRRGELLLKYYALERIVDGTVAVDFVSTMTPNA